MSTTSPEASERELPPMPDPTWYAVDTPGADFDTSFVTSLNDAEHLVGYDDEDRPTPIIKLYTADQMREYARAALRAPKVEAPPGWRLVPEKLTERMRNALLSCESGEFDTQGGWDYILSSCSSPTQAEPNPLPALAPLQVDNKPQG
jgi:hypothetical protein